MAEIFWTELALDDLREIFDFIAKDSPKYASITIDRLVIDTDLLATNPLAGRKVPEFRNAGLREIISGNYRIIYTLK